MALRQTCKSPKGHRLSILYHDSIFCRICFVTDSNEHSLGVEFECPACNETFILDKPTINECHSKNVLCIRCARKLAIVKAAYQQIMCERGEARQVLRRKEQRGAAPDA